MERQQSIRALQYSNGVRPLPLWLAYTLLDFAWVILISVVSTVLLAISYGHWYQISYVFLVFLLYGLSSALLTYIISLFAKSQLSALTFSAGGQAVMYLIYIIIYLSILTTNYSRATDANSHVNIAHFLLALFLPIGNLARALLVSLNIFSISCRGDALIAYPGDLYAYGGPILYLALQSFAYFALLVWWDSGPKIKDFHNKAHILQDEEAELIDWDILDEVRRVENSNDGLRVLHASKAFGRSTAVSDVTFGAPDGDVFALLGPNGAGKTTLISLIRGNLRMQDRRGQIFVKGIRPSQNPTTARSHLGFCPQVDAIDLLTVTEHLRLYGKIKGVTDVEHNVREVLRLIELEPYANRLASKLSGGWKRKLSLGIAIIGASVVYSCPMHR
jgi:ATP-binding cassette subfamily A (ABC1) protein 3